jgi:hypothetical protein
MCHTQLALSDAKLVQNLNTPRNLAALKNIPLFML